MSARLPEDRIAPVPDLSPLSRREREVLDAALEGLSARAIASHFTLTEATVRSHLSAIYSKLGVAGRVELLARLNVRAADLPAVPEPAIPEPALPEPAPERSVLGTQDRRRRPSRVAPGFGALLVFGLIAGAAVLVIRGSSPHGTDLGTVSRLLASNQVAQLDLVNSTLTVTETSGERLQVDNVTLDAFQPIQVVALNASVPLSMSGGTAAPLWIEMTAIASALLEIAFFLGVAVLLVRMIIRPPRLRLTN